jgi:hypothetical protein
MKRISRDFKDPDLTMQTSSESLFSMRTGAMALLTRPIGHIARWVASLTVDHERATVDTTAGANASPTPTKGDSTIIEPAGDGQLESHGVKLDGSVGLAVPVGFDAKPWPEAKLTVKKTSRWGNVELIGARKGRVPSLRERFDGMTANISLAPEMAWHGEVRLTATPTDDTSITVAPYLHRTTGTVKLGMNGLLENLGELDVHGVDVIAKARFGDRLAAGASYDYAKAHSNDLGDNPLDRFPTHRADGWLQVSPITKLSLLARVRYEGEAIDQGKTTPAYVLWDLTANALVGHGWLGVLTCDDLLDAAPYVRNGYRSPGRVISLIVQHTWD